MAPHIIPQEQISCSQSESGNNSNSNMSQPRTRSKNNIPRTRTMGLKEIEISWNYETKGARIFHRLKRDCIGKLYVNLVGEERWRQYENIYQRTGSNNENRN